MQIIPRDENFGGRLGSAFGSGIQQLADLKLANLTKRYDQQQERSHFAEGLTPILGKDTANFLSYLQPEERKHALQNIGSLLQLNQQPGQQQNGLAALSQQYGQNQQPSEQFGQQQPDQRQQLLEAARNQFTNQATGQQPFGQQGFGNAPEVSQQPQQQAQQAQGLNPDRAQLVQDIFTSPQEKRERKKLELAERQAALKEKESNFKETKEYIKTLKDKEKASKEANLRLQRMEKLIDKGNLPNAALWSSLSKLENAPFISGLTAPLAELLKGGLKWYSGNPADIEEFEKLSSEFVKNAKQYFGSRITQKEVEMYMQTVPTLMQTDKGKKKLIENIRSLNELSEIEAKAARSIIKENKGIPPIDIEQQVQDRIGNKLDKVAKEFIAK